MSASFVGAFSRTLPGSDSTLSDHQTYTLGLSLPPSDGTAAPHTFEDGEWRVIASGRAQFPNSTTFGNPTTTAYQWLERFRALGPRAVLDVRGRFSVLIFNGYTGEVWAAVDRFATFPLCYSVEGDGFLFSDRADAVPVRDVNLSAQAIFDYLYYHVIPAPRTIFDSVQRLPAGHALCWKNGALTVSRWWQPQFNTGPVDSPSVEASRFIELTRGAVARAASSGEVGTFLSGGTDSSTVTGMLSQLSDVPVPSFSIGFEAEGYDEAEYARIAARHFRTEHHEHYLTPTELLATIPTVAAHYDQPFGNSSAVPAYVCAQVAAARGVDVMLAGDGGDELFGGNTRYAKQLTLAKYERVPAALRHALLEPLASHAAMDNFPITSKAASYVRQATTPMPLRMQQYNLLRRIGEQQVLNHRLIDQIALDGPDRDQAAVWNEVTTRDALNRMLAFDWRYTLADNDLPKVIGTTRMAGIDARFPLLDDALIDYSCRLPSDWKVRHGKLRWFFKHALRQFLPAEILKKKKHGFGLPFGVWLQHDKALRRFAVDALYGTADRGVTHEAFIKTLVNDLLPKYPGYYGELVWVLMMLETWLRSRSGNNHEAWANLARAHRTSMPALL